MRCSYIFSLNIEPVSVHYSEQCLCHARPRANAVIYLAFLEITPRGRHSRGVAILLFEQSCHRPGFKSVVASQVMLKAWREPSDARASSGGGGGRIYVGSMRPAYLIDAWRIFRPPAASHANLRRSGRKRQINPL